MKKITNNVQFLVRLLLVIVFRWLITYFVFYVFLPVEVNGKFVNGVFNNYIMLREWVGLCVFRDDP